MTIRRSHIFFALFAIVFVVGGYGTPAEAASNRYLEREWPNTDFDRHAVPLKEIRSGGVRKDGIPSIDSPKFIPVSEQDDLASTEPVIGLSIGGDARAYPLRILTWHEIVNDEVGGVPVAVTYCPLCNAAIVFDRRVEGEPTEFGTTGRLRNSDLVMYDRETESWWQQFEGRAIVGERTGTMLEAIPSRLESWERFKARHPDGKVLVPTNPMARPYGRNPYVNYDSGRPFLFTGDLPENVPAMMRVVAIGDEAWTLDLLREKKRIEAEGLVITWEAGQNSALDTSDIANGRDVGNVIVQRRNENGELEDAVYDLTFAFVFHAFRPGGTLHKLEN